MQGTVNSVARRLHEACLAAEPILLLPHVGADGDAIGSSLALKIAMMKLGGNVELLLDEDPGRRLLFLPGLDLVRVYPRDIVDDDALSGDPIDVLAVALDCHSASRMGERADLFANARERIVIDHHILMHPCNDLCLVRQSASSTGELVYQVIRELENLAECPLLDVDQATLLLAALVSDTGRFSFPNTTPLCLQIASDLLTIGADIPTIAYNLFEATTPARLALVSDVLQRVNYYDDRRIALAAVAKRRIQTHGASSDDLEGVAAKIRQVDGVELALLLREAKDGVRVNIRSNGMINAAELAQRFGGGGHERAAGCTIHSTLKRAGKRLIAAVLPPGCTADKESFQGLMLIDKPRGLTSFGVIARLRKLTGIRKIGHCGTLDPFATGLLPVAIGKATGLIRYMEDYDKRYLLRVRFGTSTTTMDRTGEVVACCPLTEQELVDLIDDDFQPLRQAVDELPGEHQQLPPMYSAVKVDGRRLYSYARAGESVERTSRTIQIFSAELQDIHCEPETGYLAADVLVHCSKGTYLRTIAHELGETIGCCAHAAELRRLTVGPFRVDDAVSVTELSIVFQRTDEIRLRCAVICLCPVNSCKVFMRLPDSPELSLMSTR